MTKDEIISEEKKREVFVKAVSSEIVMGNIVASHIFSRMRPDGIIERIAAEVDVPVEKMSSGSSKSTWTCNVQIAGLLPATQLMGQSSLQVMTAATSVIGRILSQLPFANEFAESVLANFGLPVSPATTAEALVEKQNAAQRSRDGFVQRARESRLRRAEQAESQEAAQ